MMHQAVESKIQSQARRQNSEQDICIMAIYVNVVTIDLNPSMQNKKNNKKITAVYLYDDAWRGGRPPLPPEAEAVAHERPERVGVRAGGNLRSREKLAAKYFIKLEFFLEFLPAASCTRDPRRRAGTGAQTVSQTVFDLEKIF